VRGPRTSGWPASLALELHQALGVALDDVEHLLAEAGLRAVEGDALDQPGEGLAVLGGGVGGHVVHDVSSPSRMPRLRAGGHRANAHHVAGCATPTSSAGHAPTGTEADYELTFNLDHSGGAIT
jgi:hypothetical protein